MESLLQLVILFFVIFDPLASFTIFLTASSSLTKKERRRMAFLAVAVASALSVAVIVLGGALLELFSTSLDEFRIAGGVILAMLGIRMAMGMPIADISSYKNDSGRAVASIIGTPLLTGPAAITAIMISVYDYGHILTGAAVGIVLAITAGIFLLSGGINKIVGRTGIQVLSTILGLITLSWGVKFIVTGLLAMV
jgi:multiple antibiotic resistance protein